MSSNETFQLKDGDRVVFYGDSLTACHGYSDIVELYTAVTYPDRDIKFFNAGRGGDTAEGGSQRLETDVLSLKPTIVTVCFGVNDIGWGALATPERIERHYAGMKAIIEGCQKAGSRVIMLGPCPTRLPHPIPANDDDTPLRTMSIYDRKMAEDMGAQTINLYDEFRAVQRSIRAAGKDAASPTHSGDGVHLETTGNFAAAHIILKCLGAPCAASELEIDASSDVPEVKRSHRCSATVVGATLTTLHFTRKDEGWPLPLGEFGGRVSAFLPAHETLARYGLKVTGLKADASYEIFLNGSKYIARKGSELAEGVNLTHAVPPVFGPTAPWAMQSEAASLVLKARLSLLSGKDNMRHVLPADNTSLDPLRERMQRQADDLTELFHELTSTKPVLFELKEVVDEPKRAN